MGVHARSNNRVRIGFLLAALLSGAMAVSMWSCGTEEGSTFPDCDSGNCEAGVFCKRDQDCNAGSYCGATGVCVSDCSPPGSSCGPKSICTARGRCEEDPFAGTDGATDAPVDPGDSCANVNVTFTKTIPTVYLLVDQSGSMTDPFGDAGGSRWTVLRDVLVAPDGGIVKQLENDVRFGLAMYTFQGANNSPQCPTIRGVGTSIGNYSSIANVYYDAGPLGDTPTGDSIDKIMGYNQDGGLVDGGGFATLDAGGPKIIVLCTDGEPDRCEVLNPQTGQAEAIAAAQRAYAGGVRTFVIAVGPDVSLAHQRQMANAGQGLNVDAGDAGYYTANSKQDLVNAFDAIVNGVRPCIFTLNGTVQSGKESSGTVKINGVPVPYNQPNGWRLNSPSELEFLGTACQSLKSGNVSVEVSFPCGAIVVN